MIVLYFHSLASFGGAEKMLVNIANFLDDSGRNVAIITLDNKKTNSFYQINNSVKWFKVSPNKFFFKKLTKLFKFFLLFKKLKIKFLIGFVISGDKTITLATKFSGVKLIAAERNSPNIYTIKYNIIQKWIAYFNLYLADKIVLQFDSYKFNYPSFLQKKICIINNPVFSPKININSNTNKKNQILSVCRLDNLQKKIDLTIKSFNEVLSKYPNWNLLIIGSGNDYYDLKKLINSLQISRNVFIINPSKNIDKYYLESKLFITTSAWEGFPNSLAEAMSFGLPSLGLKSCDGVNNLINDNINGWLVKDSSIKSISKKLISIIENENQIVYKSEQSKNIINIFNPENIYKKWLNIISD